MTKTDIVEWLNKEFLPLTLATPNETLEQVVDNAIRYWNGHSAHLAVQMVQASGNAELGTRVQLNPQIKTVVQVYPATNKNAPLVNTPIWSLLGFAVLDNITSDLIEMTEAFKNYKSYLGSTFQWAFQQSDDPAVGGYLFMTNLGSETNFCVQGTKRILPDEDIKNELILNWILKYAKALVKMVEGNTLRKAQIIGIQQDGADLVREGEKERDDLEVRLAKEGRWVALARRF